MSALDRDRVLRRAAEADRRAHAQPAECRRHERVKLLRDGRAVCPACEAEKGRRA